MYHVSLFNLAGKVIACRDRELKGLVFKVVGLWDHGPPRYMEEGQRGLGEKRFGEEKGIGCFGRGDEADIEFVTAFVRFYGSEVGAGSDFVAEGSDWGVSG